MGIEYVSPDLVSFIFVLDDVFRDSRSVYVCLLDMRRFVVSISWNGCLVFTIFCQLEELPISFDLWSLLRFHFQPVMVIPIESICFKGVDQPVMAVMHQGHVFGFVAKKGVHGVKSHVPSSLVCKTEDIFQISP